LVIINSCGYSLFDDGRFLNPSVMASMAWPIDACFGTVVGS